VTITLGLVGAGLALLGLIAPRPLAPLNRAWTELGLLLSRVVTPVVMMLIYGLSVVPIGLGMRLLGHDPLRLKPAPEAETYWIKRDPPGPDPKSLTEQF
jgi:hypothetical protein